MLQALNHTFSSGTLFLLSFVLLLGPFSRLYGGIWKVLFGFRKELGMLAFLTGLTHVYLSMFPLARRGPWGFYTGRPWSAYPGLLGLTLMAILFVFSFKKTEKLLPPAFWWKLQYIGARLALMGIVMHTIVLRWNNWKSWDIVPTALVATLFAVYVVCVKLLEYISFKKAKVRVAALTFVFIILVGFLFIFPTLT